MNYLSIEEVAGLFGVPEDTVLGWVAAGDLAPYFKVKTSLSGLQPVHHQDEEDQTKHLLGSSTTLERGR